MEALFDKYYEFGALSTDTRKIEPNSLFVCLKGDNFNGNKFASQAINLGAGYVILDDPDYYVDNGKMSLVQDSLLFIQQLANYHRNKFNIPVIGITGSNGKTTSKELIHAVLSKKYQTLATEGNLNNHLGVPFTLLRLNSSHQIAVIEMGANKPGDIQELCAIAEPDFGIITNIGKAHLEGFGDFNGVLNTKTELYRSVASRNGSIVVNGDDLLLMNHLPETTYYRYGKDNNWFVHGELIELTPYINMRWSCKDFESPTLTTKLVGEYNFYNFLAAVTFGKLFDIPNELISEALEQYTPTNNRSQVKETTTNTLILDCYNANPSSMELALRSFSKNSIVKEKIAIIGAMKELGSESANEHKHILNLAKELSLQCITVGDEFINTDFPHYKNVDELIQEISHHPIENKLILLKGSRSIGLEKLENIL